MKKIDYSKYECPYSHLEKECGHELHSPEGYQDIYSVWCQCGFRAPVFYLDPDVLGLRLKGGNDVSGSLQDIQEIIEFLQWAFRKVDKGDTPEETVRMLLMNRAKIDSIEFDGNDR